MNPVVAASELPESTEAVQIEANHPEAGQAEGVSTGFSWYPLAGVALTLATAALTYGALLYVLKRSGVIHLHR